MLEAGIPPEWKQQIDEILVQLQDPLKLRATAIGIVCAVGFLTVYRPLNTELTTLRRDLGTARSRQAAVREIESLRSQRTKLLSHLPDHGDVNFWTEYLLQGIRESGAQLRTLETKARKLKVGKLQSVYLDIELDATYEQLYSFISWIEESKWFARIIRLRFKGESDTIEAKLTAAVLANREMVEVAGGT